MTGILNPNRGNANLVSKNDVFVYRGHGIIHRDASFFLAEVSFGVTYGASQVRSLRNLCPVLGGTKQSNSKRSAPRTRTTALNGLDPKNRRRGKKKSSCAPMPSLFFREVYLYVAHFCFPSKGKDRYKSGTDTTIYLQFVVIERIRRYGSYTTKTHFSGRGIALSLSLLF